MSEITAEDLSRIQMSISDITPENYKKQVKVAQTHLRVCLHFLQNSFSADDSFKTIENAKIADDCLYEMKRALNNAATIWAHLPPEAQQLCRIGGGRQNSEDPS